MEVFIDVHCPHCGEQFVPLLRALRPIAAGGSVEVTLRWWVSSRDPSSRDLVEHMVAADTALRFNLLASLLVGTRTGSDWKAQRERVGELFDPVIIEQHLETVRSEVTALLAEDDRRWKESKFSHLPAIILSRRTGGEIKRWSGDEVDPAAIVTMVEQQRDP